MVFAIGRRGASLGAIVCVLNLFGASAFAQGLGGAGTVQGTVKDPTGGVMQAVEVRITNPLTGFTRTTTTDAAGKYAFSNLPPNPYHLTVEAQGFQPLDARRRRTQRRADHAGPDAPARRDDELGRRGRPRGGSRRTRSDGAYRHRSEPHRETADRVVVGRPEPGRHDGVARRRRRLERVLPSDRRSRADAVLDRQPAGHRPAEPAVFQPDLAGRRAVDGSHHRRRAGRIRRQEQPRRPHRHQVGSRPAEADRQRVVRLRLVQEPDRRDERRRRLARRSATSCRSRDCGPTGSSIRPNSTRCTTPATARPSSTVSTPTPATTGTFHLNLQAARSSFDVPNTFDQNDVGQAQHQNIATFNVAPGYSRVIGGEHAVHGQRLRAAGSPDVPPSANRSPTCPATVSQDRTLTNYGGKADITINAGPHSIKFGGTISATKLHEQFTFGITDPTDGGFARTDGNFDADVAAIRPDQPRGRRSSTTSRSRSSSRPPTFRTTSRPATPRSSSACVSITTTV